MALSDCSPYLLFSWCTFIETYRVLPGPIHNSFWRLNNVNGMTHIVMMRIKPRGNHFKVRHLCLSLTFSLFCLLFSHHVLQKHIVLFFFFAQGLLVILWHFHQEMLHIPQHPIVTTVLATCVDSQHFCFF